MADRFIGIDKGQTVEAFNHGGFTGVTTGTSTTSKGIEVRYATGVGISTADVIDALGEIINYIEQTLTLENA